MLAGSIAYVPAARCRHLYNQSASGSPDAAAKYAESERLYLRKWGVHLDPDTEVINCIGSKEGFSHLMWVLLQPGDAAIVPTPSYPIHIYGPLFATFPSLLSCSTIVPRARYRYAGRAIVPVRPIPSAVPAHPRLASDRATRRAAWGLL